MLKLDITREICRALGEGVQRLNDGDSTDCEAAQAVVAVMEAKGYALCGYEFVSQDRILVIRYCCKQGADYGQLPAAVLASLCLVAGLPEDGVDLDQRIVDAPEGLIGLIADEIRAGLGHQ